MEDRRPLIADIKRNSLDDGPGIRSVVFFKGCPLRCVWCHNPECMDPGPEILFRPDKCIGCGSCRDSCPEGAIGPEGPVALNRQACSLCGRCAEECPTGALSLIGKYYTPEDLADTLARDKAFYDNSGGGVTLSGGEPTLFVDYAAQVARNLRGRGIRVLVETCGDFPWESFETKLAPYIDQVFIDLKVCDEALHKRYTGRSNRRILRNIERLVAESIETLVRIPLVPEVTATEENLAGIAEWMRGQGLARVALLPYNPLWIGKARGLGKVVDYHRETWMTREERDKIRRIFDGFEIAREI